MKTLLIDMDGPLVNFDLGIINAWRKKYPNLPYIPLEERTTFYVEDDYPKNHKSKVQKIYKQKGFFKNLTPTDGALGAVRYIDKYLHDRVRIFFCTSPISFYKFCVTEKYQWIEHHLGPEFVKKIILTSDKTAVKGTFLLDDKPKITGSMEPEWEHIIFDMPYNRQAPGRHLSWSSWQWLLDELR